MITFRQQGDFSRLTRFLERAKEAVKLGDLDKYGQAGVAALAAATPVDSGLTAKSWSYKVTNRGGVATITFNNSNIQNGVPTAAKPESPNIRFCCSTFFTLHPWRNPSRPLILKRLRVNIPKY